MLSPQDEWQQLLSSLRRELFAEFTKLDSSLRGRAWAQENHNEQGASAKGANCLRVAWYLLVKLLEGLKRLKLKICWIWFDLWFKHWGVVELVKQLDSGWCFQPNDMSIPETGSMSNVPSWQYQLFFSNWVQVNHQAIKVDLHFTSLSEYSYAMKQISHLEWFERRNTPKVVSFMVWIEELMVAAAPKFAALWPPFRSHLWVSDECRCWSTTSSLDRSLARDWSGASHQPPQKHQPQPQHAPAQAKQPPNEQQPQPPQGRNPRVPKPWLIQWPMVFFSIFNTNLLRGRSSLIFLYAVFPNRFVTDEASQSWLRSCKVYDRGRVPWSCWLTG